MSRSMREVCGKVSRRLLNTTMVTIYRQRRLDVLVSFKIDANGSKVQGMCHLGSI